MRTSVLLMSTVFLLGCDASPVDIDGGFDGGFDAARAFDARVPDAGLLGLGQPCVESDECESAVCLHGFCSRTCRPDRSDCDAIEDGRDYACLEGVGTSLCYRVCPLGEGCVEGESCSRVNLDDEFHLVCTPSCRVDRDCSSGEICELRRGPAWLSYQCIPAPTDGRNPVGQSCDPRSGAVWPCDVDADCFDGWTCVAGSPRGQCRAPATARCQIGACPESGRCSGLCQVHDDCPMEMRCATGAMRTWQGLPHLTRSCVYAPGSGVSCAAASHCVGTGEAGADEVCTAPTFLQGMCRTPPDPETYGGWGAACGDDFMTAPIEFRPCASGICLFGHCIDICEGDGDCPGAAVCSELPYGDWPVRVCNSLTRCDGDSMCAPGETCAWVFTTDGAVTHCQPRGGDLAAGDECQPAHPSLLLPSERCASGNCNSVRGTGVGRCDSPCGSDTDCPADHLCERLSIRIGSNRTLDPTDDVRIDLLHCDQVPGSRSPCATSADCPAGEACWPHYDVTGAWTPLCVTAVPGGAAPGEACGPSPCAGLLCVDRWLASGGNYCSALCESDADCPELLVCRRTGDPGGRWCVDPTDPRTLE